MASPMTLQVPQTTLVAISAAPSNTPTTTSPTLALLSLALLAYSTCR